MRSGSAAMVDLWVRAALDPLTLLVARVPDAPPRHVEVASHEPTPAGRIVETGTRDTTAQRYTPNVEWWEMDMPRTPKPKEKR